MTGNRTASYLLVIIAVVCFFFLGVSGLIIPGTMLLTIKILTAVEDEKGSLFAVLSGTLYVAALVYLHTIA